MKGSRLLVALVTITAYEIIMTYLDPDGFSLFKVSITLLVWLSLYQSVSVFVLRYKDIKDVMPPYAFRIFMIMILWNFINIARSAADPSNSLTTLLGNQVTSLALLVPFSISFSIEKENIPTAYRYFLRLIMIAIPFYVIFLLLSGAPDEPRTNLTFQYLLYGTVFLISTIPFQDRTKNLLVLAGSAMLSLAAVHTEYRTMLIRIVLVFISIAGVFLLRRYNFKLILIAACLCLCLPFYLLVSSIITRESAFEKYLVLIDDPELGSDTRTFLYTEVYDDLKYNELLTVGKGSVARYYSPYFETEEGDHSLRLSVEAGILAIMLSGGFIAVFLNLALLLIAIYLALFRSRNYFVVSIGFFLIVHTILLFIESFVVYSLYNLMVWFLVGICLSEEIRSMNNTKIYNLLNHETTVS